MNSVVESIFVPNQIYLYCENASAYQPIQIVKDSIFNVILFFGTQENSEENIDFANFTRVCNKKIRGQE